MVSKIRVEHGDSRDVIKTLADASIDACVTDPPYSLVSIQKRFANAKAAAETYAMQKSNSAYMSRGFMGKAWDTGEVAHDPAFWAEVLRVLKPGAHLVAFGGTRTYHRLVCAIEDAGFEIRDQIGWVFGSGFPKSHDVSKGIDKAAGAEREKIRVNASEVRNPKATGGGRDGTEGATRPWIDVALANGYHEKDGDEPVTDAARQWQGWGTALKPAWEPICLARKPLGEKTVAANVLAHGTGALNIDASRVEAAPGDKGDWPITGRSVESNSMSGDLPRSTMTDHTKGRWPANLITDGSAEVLAGFPDTGISGIAVQKNGGGQRIWNSANTIGARDDAGFADSGSAARYFYTAKADADDRLKSRHPTVKPVDLMAYLVRLVTPPGGTVLDPFAGSGSTGMAAMREGFDCLLIEREAEYVADIRYRLEHVDGSDTPLFAAPMAPAQPAQPSLFDPYADGWPDAAANSKGCYDVAIEAIREQLVRDQSS